MIVDANHKDVFKAEFEAGLKEHGLTLDVQSTFCDAWPKVYKVLLSLIGAFGFLYPTLAAEAKAVLAVVNKSVYPLICGV